MLVLSRKVDEAIIITLPDGSQVKVILRKIDRNKCRIGIVAPEHISVNREELQDRINTSKGTN